MNKLICYSTDSTDRRAYRASSILWTLSCWPVFFYILKLICVIFHIHKISDYAFPTFNPFLPWRIAFDTISYTCGRSIRSDRSSFHLRPDQWRLCYADIGCPEHYYAQSSQGEIAGAFGLMHFLHFKKWWISVISSWILLQKWKILLYLISFIRKIMIFYSQ